MVLKVTVTHPEHGHVVFTSPTVRQQEVLEAYQKLISKTKKEKNG